MLFEVLWCLKIKFRIFWWRKKIVNLIFYGGFMYVLDIFIIFCIVNKMVMIKKL